MLRSCDQDDERQLRSELGELQASTRSLLQERDHLHDSLAAQLSKLLLAMKAAAPNATHNATQLASVAPAGGVLPAGASLLGGLLAASKF